MHHNSNAFAYNFNSFSSMFQSLPEHPHSLATSSSRLKKKYSKVNETIKKEFLSLIIQHNMSIKQASHALNINYSSAKAILANHRKNLHPPKPVDQDSIQASYKSLLPLERMLVSFSVICSTGGCQTSVVDQFEKDKSLFKSCIAPVILVRGEKQANSAQNTQHENNE